MTHLFPVRFLNVIYGPMVSLDEITPNIDVAHALTTDRQSRPVLHLEGRTMLCPQPLQRNSQLVTTLENMSYLLLFNNLHSD